MPIVTYVNTSAAVKAESDICCTSGNARKIIESLGVPRVIMIPDEYLAKNIAAETGVEIITWKGHCEVHERFGTEEVAQLREDYPGVVILAHPECPPEVVQASDFSGSTAAIANYVAQATAGARRAAHRMLDERQYRDPISGARVHSALQSLPAYEAHLADEYPQRAGDDAA